MLVYIFSQGQDTTNPPTLNTDIEGTPGLNARLNNPIIWSPKALLKRSPSKGELATLSHRISTLNQYGLIEKRGRYVKVTDDGKRLLYAYLLEHESDDIMLYTIRLWLDMDKSIARILTIANAMQIADEYGMSELSSEDGGSLSNLLKLEMKETERLTNTLLEVDPPEDEE